MRRAEGVVDEAVSDPAEELWMGELIDENEFAWLARRAVASPPWMVGKAARTRSPARKLNTIEAGCERSERVFGGAGETTWML